MPSLIWQEGNWAGPRWFGTNLTNQNPSQWLLSNLAYCKHTHTHELTSYSCNFLSCRLGDLVSWLLPALFLSHPESVWVRAHTVLVCEPLMWMYVIRDSSLFPHLTYTVSVMSPSNIWSLELLCRLSCLISLNTQPSTSVKKHLKAALQQNTSLM